MKTAEEYFNKGVEFLANDDFDNALALYHKAIEVDSDYAPAWNGLGNVYYALKEFKKASGFYQKATAIDSKYISPLCNLGGAFFELKEYGDSFIFYNKALALKSDFTPAWFGLGNVCAIQDKYREAIKYYRKAVEINPNFIDAWDNLGRSYYLLENNKESIRCYSKVCELDPECFDNWDKLGISFSNIRKIDKALQCFEKAIEIHPNDAENWYNIGTLFYQEFKDVPVAMKYLFRYIFLARGREEHYGKITILIRLIKELPDYPLLTIELFKYIVNPDSYISYSGLYLSAINKTQTFTKYLIFLDHNQYHQHNTRNFNLLKAYISYVMGYPPAAYEIYNEVNIFNDERIDLQGLYYHCLSAQGFLEPEDDIIHLGITRAKECIRKRKKHSEKDIYYAGQIFYLNEKFEEAYKCFDMTKDFLPSCYMQLHVLSMLHLDLEKELTIQRIINLEKESKGNGFINGFTKQAINLKTPDFLQQFSHYAIHSEISYAVAEAREYIEDNYKSLPYFFNSEYDLPVFWDAFYFIPEDEDIVNKNLLSYEKNKILNELENYWKLKGHSLKNDNSSRSVELLKKQFRNKDVELKRIIKELDEFTGDQKEIETHISLLIKKWEYSSKIYLQLIKLTYLENNIDSNTSLYLCFFIFEVERHKKTIKGSSKQVDIWTDIIVSLFGFLASGPLSMPFWIGGASAIILKYFIKHQKDENRQDVEWESLNIDNFKSNFKQFIYELRDLHQDKFVKEFPFKEFFGEEK